MVPVRDKVMAVLHLVVVTLYLPWLAMHALVLLALGQVALFRASASALALSLALHGAAALGLVVAAVGLFRGAWWGRTFSLLYAVLAAGAALLLWLTGARLWFVLLLLAYPFAVAWVFLRPEVPAPGARGLPTGPGAGPRDP